MLSSSRWAIGCSFAPRFLRRRARSAGLEGMFFNVGKNFGKNIYRCKSMQHKYLSLLVLFLWYFSLLCGSSYVQSVGDTLQCKEQYTVKNNRPIYGKTDCTPGRAGLD